MLLFLILFSIGMWGLTFALFSRWYRIRRLKRRLAAAQQQIAEAQQQLAALRARAEQWAMDHSISYLDKELK